MQHYVIKFVNKTDRYNIAEILLKVALNTIDPTSTLVAVLSSICVQVDTIPHLLAFRPKILMYEAEHYYTKSSGFGYNFYPLANEVAKEYSNATIPPSFRPSHPCEHSRINILQWILTKLGTYLVFKRIWNPIDFQGHRSKVKVTRSNFYHITSL